MTAINPTLREALDSVTGRDELAVLDVFGTDLWDDYDVVYGGDDEDPPKKVVIRMLRMLVFTHKLHQGLPVKVAEDTAMEMTVPQINGYFTATTDDDEAGDAEGKDASGDA